MTTMDKRIVPRTDGFEKVTGEARYAADITRPGMLWAKVLRSPLPHARIVRIDTHRAAALPGVFAVLTGDDLPPYRLGRSMRDMPVLAREKVRFVGEKVVAVAAADAETAEAAVGLIEVEYDELPAVFDPVEATRPGGPLVHDPQTVRAWAVPEQVVADYPNSVSSPAWGATLDEVERAMAEADHVFEHTFRTPVQHQGYLEPHAALVELDGRGVAHIWASQKAPFLLLNYLRAGLGLSREELDFHLVPLGGDFGGKGSFMDIPLVYLLAKNTGRPVKMVMTYVEELMAGCPRHSAVVTVKSGFDGNGRLVARHTRAYFASGGYAAFKPSSDVTLPVIGRGGLGAYDVPVWRVEGHMVYTNTVPCGHMRAPGEAQTLQAVECHTDLCARALGMDPLELRLMNVPTQPRETHSGGPGSLPGAREVLRAAAMAIGWDQPRADGVGRGIAIAPQAPGMGAYLARMAADRNGQLVLHTPIVEQGSGMLTVFRQMVANEWGLPLEQVRVEQTTQGFDYDRGVGGSRTTRMYSRMVPILVERVQTRLASMLAAELGHGPESVSVEPRGFRTPDGRFHTLAEAAALADSDVVELLRYEGSAADEMEVYTAQATEVHVDRETGHVRLVRAVSAHEVGKVINPMLHRGQIEGGLLHGYGYAVTEGLRIEDGRVTSSNLHEYKLPCIADIPELEVILLPEDESLGATAIGEGHNCGLAAALVNAVVDALAPQQIDIPLSPQRIREIANGATRPADR